MQWHCYNGVAPLGSNGNIVALNVEAATAEEAAAEAARVSSRAGAWTVVAGTPVHLSVSVIRNYEARRV